jgi:probable addiction module antidote protein
MAKTTTSAPDPRFSSPEGIAEFLNEAFETNDPALIVRKIGVVARAKGVSEISRKTNHRARPSIARSTATRRPNSWESYGCWTFWACNS